MDTDVFLSNKKLNKKKKLKTKQCSLHNHCLKNLLDPSPHSVLIPQFSWSSNVSPYVHSARCHFETYNFRPFDTHVTDAKTDKGTLDWTKGITRVSEIDAVSVM